MPAYSRRERHVTYVEFIVPAPPGLGAPYGELRKAMHAAETELRAAEKLGPTAVIPEDALWVFPGDEDLVIQFTREDTAMQ